MPKKMTKTEKLLSAIRKNRGMTRKEMVTFLLKMNGKKYDTKKNGDTYNALLYGTRKRFGILERYCRPAAGYKWNVLTRTKSFAKPFTPACQGRR